MSILLKRLASFVLVAALIVAACSEPTAPPRAVPGTLTLSLTSPNADDRALLAYVVLPRGVTVTAVTAESGFEVFHRIAVDTVRLAVFGDLRTGAFVRVAVSDARAPERARVVEVSGPDDRLREDLAGYIITVRE